MATRKFYITLAACFTLLWNCADLYHPSSTYPSIYPSIIPSFSPSLPSIHPSTQLSHLSIPQIFNLHLLWISGSVGLKNKETEASGSCRACPSFHRWSWHHLTCKNQSVLPFTLPTYLPSLLKDRKGMYLFLECVGSGCWIWGPATPLTKGATRFEERQTLQKPLLGGRRERVILTHSLFAKMWILSDSQTHFHDKTLGKRRWRAGFCRTIFQL